MGRQIVKSQTPKFTFKVCLLLFFLITFNAHIHTYMPTHFHSTYINGRFSHISEGRQGQGSFFPAVGIYVLSLFNLIALETSGGQHAFLE